MSDATKHPTTPANPYAAGAGGRGILNELEEYVTQYVTLAEPGYSFVLALWTVGTFLWPHFDAFPYMVITSSVKRSGKTRLGETLSFVCSNPRNFAATTAAGLFRMIRDELPTMIIDEAETLSKETADTMRAFLNVGYRRGQSIPRLSKGGVEEWPAYCPKVFILIGDVFDTLRDRSVIVRMQRAEPKRRFVFTSAASEGAALRDRVAGIAEEHQADILNRYTRHQGLPFLGDRDEEIWLPLFAICEILAPKRVRELQGIAADMSVLKTEEARRYVNLLSAEEGAEDDEYARRLARDLHTVLNGAKSIFTQDALDRLHALPTGPWRKFRGTGLSAIDMGNLLKRFGVNPTTIRAPGAGRKGKPAKGYKRADVEKALQTLGVK